MNGWVVWMRIMKEGQGQGQGRSDGDWEVVGHKKKPQYPPKYKVAHVPLNIIFFFLLLVAFFSVDLSHSFGNRMSLCFNFERMIQKKG